MKHTIEVLDMTGHSTLEFDPAVDAEVEATRTKFNQLMERGFTAIDPQKGKLTEFTPEAEDVVMIPHIVGG